MTAATPASSAPLFDPTQRPDSPYYVQVYLFDGKPCGQKYSFDDIPSATAYAKGFTNPKPAEVVERATLEVVYPVAASSAPEPTQADRELAEVLLAQEAPKNCWSHELWAYRIAIAAYRIAIASSKIAAHRASAVALAVGPLEAEIAQLTFLAENSERNAELGWQSSAKLEARVKELEGRIEKVRLAVDGYIDGAPDCSAVSKLANEVSLIIDPT